MDGPEPEKEYKVLRSFEIKVLNSPKKAIAEMMNEEVGENDRNIFAQPQKFFQSLERTVYMKKYSGLWLRSREGKYNICKARSQSFKSRRCGRE